MMIGIGAAYGTAKSGIGIAGVGTFRPDLIMKVGPANNDIIVSKQTHLTFPVSDPRRHVRYHWRLFSSYLSPHR
jgi:hypothetical protein